MGVLLLVAGAACGGDAFRDLDEESDFGSEVTDEAAEIAASRTVDDVEALADMTEADEIDDRAVAFFGNLAAAPLQIVSGALYDDMARAAEGGHGETPALRVMASAGAADDFEECIEEGDDEIRMEDCEVETEITSTSMDGVLAIEPETGRLVIDVELDVTMVQDDGDPGQEVSTGVYAEVLITPDRIEGRLDVDSDTSSQGGSASQTAVAVYDVEVEDGCAVGGDLRVGVEQSARAGGASQSARAIGRAAFGPECGDVTVFARED